MDQLVIKEGSVLLMHGVTMKFMRQGFCQVYHMMWTDIRVIQFPDYENRGGSHNFIPLALQPLDADARPKKFHRIRMPGMLHMIFCYYFLIVQIPRNDQIWSQEVVRGLLCTDYIFWYVICNVSM